MSVEPGARRALGPAILDVVLLLALWLVVVIAVDPRGDFPLNDDWAYFGAVRQLLDEGVFHLPGWAGMPLISQAVWGAGFAAVAGLSHETLRASTLVLGAVAVIAAYLLARQLGAARSLAWLAAVTLMVNPLFVVLAHGFMTDVPALAAMLLALLAYARALQSGSRAAWILGTAATVVGVLCRQPAIVPAFGVAAAVLWCPPARWRLLPHAALAVAASVGALWLFQHLMLATVGLPTAYWKSVDFLSRLWNSSARSVWLLVSGNFGVAMLYSGLFLLPLLIAGAPGWRAGQRRRSAMALATLAGVTLLLWWSGRPLPLRGNVIIPSGIGPITLNDWYIRGLANDPRLPAWFWWTATALAAGGVALLAAQAVAALACAWRQRRDAGARGAARAMLLATAVLYLGTACVAIQFDRYFLVLVPIVGVALLPPDDGRALGSRTWLAAMMALLLLAAYGVAGTHDYLAWNRARWQALHQLAAEGVDAKRIDGGLEFNAPLFYIEGSSPSSGSGRSWWWVVDDEYVVAMGPVAGYEVVREIPYSRWMPGSGTIAVLHRAPR